MIVKQTLNRVTILFLFCLVIIGCGGSSNTNPDQRLEMIDLINAARSANGLPPLTHNASLSGVAQVHSDDMVNRNFLSHINPDGHDYFFRADVAGIPYSGLGENVSAGFKTMKAAHNSFMNSTSHRNNILNINADQVGVGYTWGTPSHYYGQSLYVCVMFLQSP